MAAPRVPMHIVERVAHELVASGAKRTVVKLSCCHKTFETPVLGILWETQHRLLLLLKLLPGSIIQGPKCTVSAPTTTVLPVLNYLI